MTKSIKDGMYHSVTMKSLLVIISLIVFSVPSVLAVDGKYVIFTMDDNPLGQYIYAKPVLDTYGYKASFMVVCNWVGGGGETPRMSWDQITNMSNDGQDIESHTMTHPDLNTLSLAQLQYELGASKDCLQQHGFNVTAFAYPRNLGSENATVVNVVSQYYTVAKTLGQGGIYSFTQCNAYKQGTNQNDCAVFDSSGKLQYENPTAMRFFSIDGTQQGNGFNDNDTFYKFKNFVDNQTQYNFNGSINAIPVVTLHEIINPSEQSYWLHTNQLLLANMMHYIHDHNYTVITLRDVGVNPLTHTLYVKGIQQPTQTLGSILQFNKISYYPMGSTMSVTGKLSDMNGNPLVNKTIYFTGNGVNQLLPTITKPDGTFLASQKTPMLPLPVPNPVWNQFHINAIYNGDANITGSVSMQYFAITAPQTITTLPSPLVKTFTSNVTSGIHPFSVRFSFILSNVTAPYTSQWTFGDGKIQFGGTVISHKYLIPGNYTISLYVTQSARNETKTLNIFSN